MTTPTAVLIGIAGLIGVGVAFAGGEHSGGHGHHPMHGHDHMGHHGDTAHWSAPAEAAARENPVSPTPESVAQGQALYSQYCASCHGAEGRGDGPAGAALNPPPANLAVMAPQHPAGDLAWKVANGRGAMPAWEQVLTEQQIWDLVNYMKALESGS